MIEKYEYDTSLTANGGCYLCGSTNGLVSTGVIIEGEGLLTLCRGHINDMAVTAGFVVNGTDEFEAIRHQRDLAYQLGDIVSAQRDEAEAKLADLREQWVEAVESRNTARPVVAVDPS